jgi:hypothetical protein
MEKEKDREPRKKTGSTVFLFYLPYERSRKYL